MSTIREHLIAMLLIILVFSLSPHGQAGAAPDITGVSGSISDGAAVTISGSGFGAKSPAKPLLWADFEDGNANPTNLGVKTAWDRNYDFIQTANNQPLNSTSAVVGEYNAGQGKTGSAFLIEYTSYDKIYAFWKRYRDFSPPDPINMKFFRIWPASGGTTNDFLAEYLINPNPNSVGRCYTENTGESMSSSYQGTVYTQNEWNREEFQWSQNSAVDVADGTWRYRRDGILQQTRDNLIGRSSSQGGDITRLYIDNYAGGSGNIYMPPDGSKVYMDDIYIDTTWARVMIGDQNTFSSSTNREIQIPSAWSDTSVTIKINQGSFSNLTDVYLYIVDANGNVNTTGFLLCAKCPRSPSNLR